jgi:hypothetical protein
MDDMEPSKQPLFWLKNVFFWFISHQLLELFLEYHHIFYVGYKM